MPHSTPIPPDVQYSQAPESGWLHAVATGDGMVLGVLRDYEGTLYLAYVNDPDTPGLEIPRSAFPAVIDMMRIALSMLEGGE